jgi:2-oxoglutarate ferredoxin oxidoreductase subunit alpha
VHLRHLNPFPKYLGEILKHYDAVMISEMNLGQLSLLIRATYLLDVVGYDQVNGMPLKAAELAVASTGVIHNADTMSPQAMARGEQGGLLCTGLDRVAGAFV